MLKNSYMSRTEQDVMRVLEGVEIVSFEDVSHLFPELSRDMVRKVLSSLSKKGYLFRLKRGLYAVGDPATKNPYRIALALFPGYIAFSSALRLYNLMEYEPFTLFVATPGTSGERRVGEYTIKAVALGERATGVTSRDGIYVSTLAKTFFDCFYKPCYCGGYSEITKALYEAHEVNWGEFLSYFKRFASSSLCQRTGYVLEIVRDDVGAKVPESVIEYLLGRVKAWTRLVPTLPSRGTGIGRWKLIDNLGKERILGWAYG